MKPSEGIDWLRERGVQISLPSTSSSSHATSSPLNESLNREISIVKIPWDTSRPYEEVKVTINDGVAGDQLISLLKPYFVGDGTGTLSRESSERAVQSLLTKQSMECVNESQRETLTMMIQSEGHVEAFCLSRPCSNNEWKSVAAYLDEGGSLKGLPFNSRASGIAEVCGFEGVSLLGDVFIARRHQEGVMRHISCNLQDVDSSSTWMQQAWQDNYEAGVKSGQVSMETGDGSDSSRDHSKKYEWSQDEETIDISYPLPSAIVNSTINVSILPTQVKVIERVDNSDSKEEKIILELNLFAPIRVSNSTWSRSDSIIDIVLEKSQELEWASLENPTA